MRLPVTLYFASLAVVPTFVCPRSFHARPQRASKTPLPLRQRPIVWTIRGGSTVTNQEEEESDDDDGHDHRIQRYERASTLRQLGKERHDNGNWYEAAQLFSQAADLLHEFDDFRDDQATCQLHQALCSLKCEHYDDCVHVCSELLESEDQSGAVRARALYRRSKAYVGLERPEEALQDARSAAFLGDRKAVALYGKLMREHGGTSDTWETTGTHPAMLNDLFSGKNPFESTANPLFTSLMNKSPLSNHNSATTAATDNTITNPLASLLSGNGGGLAQSVLSNLSKKLETESDTICKYLNGASKDQLQSLAAMGGVPLSDHHASTIVTFCHKVTPKRIQWTVTTSKRLWYVISIIRKTMKLITKYKFVLVAWFVVAWIQASITRPVPINKKAVLQAAKVAAAGAAR